jgi:very-short-patch-repair endonuclease
MSSKQRIAQQIAQVAERQHGHVTRPQLLALGLSPWAVHRRIENGELIPVHQGVYAVGHRRPEAVAKAAAALLACGDDSVLSHASAAALWGFLRWPSRPEVTVRARRRRPGIRLHTHPLPKQEVRRQQNLRVTSAERALLDVTPRLTDKQLARAFNQGRLDRTIKLDKVGELLDRHPGQRGSRRLRQIAGLADDEPTRSAFEDEFPAFARRFNLPTPRINAHVAGHRVDILFEQERVIVELDGWDTHRDRQSFEADRERDADTTAAGYVTIRITWRRLREHPDREAERLRTILERRRVFAQATVGNP